MKHHETECPGYPWIMYSRSWAQHLGQKWKNLTNVLTVCRQHCPEGDSSHRRTLEIFGFEEFWDDLRHPGWHDVMGHGGHGPWWKIHTRKALFWVLRGALRSFLL